MSMSRSPELLTLKPLETVGRAGERVTGERTNEIVNDFNAGDALTMARSSETSRSRRSFMCVNLEQQIRAQQKMVVPPPDTLVLNAEDVLEVRLEFIG
jgi:hypothetical protein